MNYGIDIRSRVARLGLRGSTRMVGLSTGVRLVLGGWELELELELNSGLEPELESVAIFGCRVSTSLLSGGMRRLRVAAAGFVDGVTLTTAFWGSFIGLYFAPMYE